MLIVRMLIVSIRMVCMLIVRERIFSMLSIYRGQAARHDQHQEGRASILIRTNTRTRSRNHAR